MNEECFSLDFFSWRFFVVKRIKHSFMMVIWLSVAIDLLKAKDQMDLLIKLKNFLQT